MTAYYVNSVTAAQRGSGTSLKTQILSEAFIFEVKTHTQNINYNDIFHSKTWICLKVENALQMRPTQPPVLGKKTFYIHAGFYLEDLLNNNVNNNHF